MPRTTFNELLDAGVHFGHLRRKWNPNMAPYIFMERNGIHIIDLYKTSAKIEEAASAIKQIAKSGKKVLFVATKKQAKDIVASHVKQVGMPYVTERWPGGMLTNFATIRKAVRKMASIDKMMTTDNYLRLSKRERLQIQRERAKLEKQLGSISDLNRLPSALFVVDINKEHIAIAEARKLNIPTFAIVDTNSDPQKVDFPIPANDDASKSIELITRLMAKAIEEGLVERKLDRDKRAAEKEEEETIEDVDTKSGSKELDIDEDEVAVKAKRAKLVKKVKIDDPDEEEVDDKAEKPKVKKTVSKAGKKPQN